MYKQTVQLAPNETLELEWSKNYADLSLFLNGRTLGSFADKASLKLGNRFYLPGEDHRQITVLLADQGLEVWHNGTDLLSGLKNGETDHFANSVLYLIVFGTLESLAGALIALLGRNDQIMLGVGSVSLLSGLLVIGLSIWAKKSGTTLPLKLACSWLILTMLVVMWSGWFGAFIIGGLIYYVSKGIQSGALQPLSVQEFDDNGPLDAGI